MPEGRQSPPPEAQKPVQIDVPSSGHAADQTSRESQSQVKPEEQLKVCMHHRQPLPLSSRFPGADARGGQNLESNPAEIMKEERERKFAKHEGN
jgi:hypothetical protein